MTSGYTGLGLLSKSAEKGWRRRRRRRSRRKGRRSTGYEEECFQSAFCTTLYFL